MKLLLLRESEVQGETVFIAYETKEKKDGTTKSGEASRKDAADEAGPTPATHAILTPLKAGRCARHSI